MRTDGDARCENVKTKVSCNNLWQRVVAIFRKQIAQAQDIRDFCSVLFFGQWSWCSFDPEARQCCTHIFMSISSLTNARTKPKESAHGRSKAAQICRSSLVGFKCLLHTVQFVGAQLDQFTVQRYCLQAQAYRCIDCAAVRNQPLMIKMPAHSNGVSRRYCC